MIYSTCSILRKENDMQIAAFLETNTDALLLEAAPGEMIESHFGRYFTSKHSHDVIFCAMMVKK